MRSQELPGGSILGVHRQALGRGQETTGRLADIAASLEGEGGSESKGGSESERGCETRDKEGEGR